MIDVRRTVRSLAEGVRRTAAWAVVAGAGVLAACTAVGDDDATGAAAVVQSATSAADDDALPIPSIRLAPAFPKLALRRPVFIGHAGDGSDRLFIVEQAGRILVIPNDPSVAESTVFLDLQAKVLDRGNEEGLLALAFHPRYAENGQLFVYYTTAEPRRGVVSRFLVDAQDPNRADPESEEVILEVAQPWPNHNGSTVLFGPDGMCYISLGDGGYANDPLNSGQDLTTLLGTVLRIDVDRRDPGRAYAIPPDNPFVGHDAARGEIWAYGLRNVWRMSFDRATGELWGGDVGQNAFEEIDLIVRGGNYGWNIREGRHPFRGRRDEQGGSDADVDPATLIEPVAEYPRNKGLSVTGGNVYRGRKYPSLDGVYFYADYVSGRIWGLRHEADTITGPREVIPTSATKRHISSFGEDEAGELYVCAFDRIDGRRGRIFQVRAR